MINIEQKYKDLCKEIKWRFKESDYKEDDKANVVMHETIDKDVSFISIAEVKTLSDELGVSKMLEIETSFMDEFGEMSKEKIGIDKLRVLLYWYFEQRIYEDDSMRKELKI